MKIFFKHKLIPRLGLPALLLLLCSSGLYAQDVNYISGVVNISSGEIVRWYGDVEIAADAVINIQDGAQIIFYGNNMVVHPGAQIIGTNWTKFSAGSGTGRITFHKPHPIDNSVGQQTLDGGNTGSQTVNAFPFLEIDNTDGVRLLSNTRVGGSEDDPSFRGGHGGVLFTSGHMFLDKFDLIKGTSGHVVNANNSRYFVTDVAAPTGGHLVYEDVDPSMDGLFPVGMAVNDYTPVWIFNSVGSNTLHVNVTDYDHDAPLENTGSDGMNRSWNIYGDNTSGYNIALVHNNGTNGTKWLSGANFVTQYGSTNPNLTGDKTSGVKSQWQSNNTSASNASFTGGPANSETNLRQYNVIATSAAANEAWFSKASNVINPLPLKLLSFNANKQLGSSSNTAIVTWTVAEQVNTQSFVVEHSTDGQHYTEIGSKAAAGNFAGEITYTFTDAKAQNGINYYRLKMVDIDGQFTRSAVKTVTFDANATATVYLTPNPTRGQFFVKGLTAASIVRVLDMSGKVLQTYNGATQFSALNISQLPSAVYLVQVIEEGKFAGTFKVVKE